MKTNARKHNSSSNRPGFSAGVIIRRVEDISAMIREEYEKARRSHSKIEISGILVNALIGHARDMIDHGYCGLSNIEDFPALTRG